MRTGFDRGMLNSGDGGAGPSTTGRAATTGPLALATAGIWSAIAQAMRLFCPERRLKSERALAVSTAKR
jgi:hypothetical protein